MEPQQANVLTRAGVYARIDSERAYQERRWTEGSNPISEFHSFEEWCVYIEDYVAEAKHLLSRGSTRVCAPQVSAIMRKVAAMAVCCLEQHGCNFRTIPMEQTNASSDE